MHIMTKVTLGLGTVLFVISSIAFVIGGAELDSALEETVLIGVDSLIPLHRQILRELDFIERNITTDYLESHPDLLTGGH